MNRKFALRKQVLLVPGQSGPGTDPPDDPPPDDDPPPKPPPGGGGG